MRAFVIAMENEAACVRPWLGAGDDRRLFVSGVGKVNAAASAMKAICAGADEIWNVGVCGGFGETVEVGGIYLVEKAVEYDFDLAQLNGTAVGVLNECDSPYLEPPAAAAAARLGAFPWYGGARILATGDRFSDSEADDGLIDGTLRASLRDMEGAAIAHVCVREGVRFLSLKCVTNRAGCGSMTGQYRENLDRCLARLSCAVRDLLESESRA